MVLWEDYHIANAAMAMLCVVPGGKVLRPLTGFCDVGKGLIRVVRHVLKGLKQRLRIRVIIARRRTTKGRHHA